MPRVLVVDDNEDAADTLALLLSLGGHDVRVAYDGAAAVEVLQEFTADVAVIDIDVPTLDGCFVARWFKASLPSVRLIAMSRAPLEDPAAVRHAGFGCVLVKPFPIRALEDVLPAVAGRAGREPAGVLDAVHRQRHEDARCCEESH